METSAVQIKNPIKQYLPEARTGCEFSLDWKGSLLRVSVKAGSVGFKLKSGPPVTVFVDGKAYLVQEFVEVCGSAG